VIKTSTLRALAYFSILLTHLLIFGLVQGSLGPERSPLQPDSWNYICRALDLAQVDIGKEEEILAQLQSRFDSSLESNRTCGVTPEHYKGRLLLPVLLVPSILIGKWWLIGVPNLLGCLLMAFIWFRIIKLEPSVSFKKGLVAMIPFLAIQLFPQMGLVLSDTFTVLFFLLILFIAREVKDPSLAILLILIFQTAGLLSRQSWPFFVVAAVFHLKQRYVQTSSVSIRIMSILLIFYPFFLSIFIDYDIVSKTDQEYSIEAGMKGVALGLHKDVIDTLIYGDIFMLAAILVLLFNLFRFRGDTNYFLLVMLCGISVVTQARVYLGDMTYGQNWRYWLITYIYSLYVWLDNEKRFDQIK
jgi:hypothetical protein